MCALWPLVLGLSVLALLQVVSAQSVAGTHRAFAVLDEVPHCAVHGVMYDTSLDCAIAHAKDWSEQSQQPSTVELGSGVYETKLGLQMSANGSPTVNLKGLGKGEFQGGSTIKLIAPIATGVLTFPFLSPDRQSGYWSDLHLESFSVDANGNAPMCMDLYALRVAHLSDLSCTGATGLRAWVRIGGYGADIGGTVPKGLQGLAFQVIAQDIFIWNNSTGPAAVVRPRVVHGVIAEYAIESSGIYREKARAPVLLKGPVAGDIPCAVMPTGLEAQLVEDGAHPGLRKVARITARTPGSGCKSILRVSVPDMPPAQYGFEIAATDSSFYDLTDDSVGTVAAITDRGSNATVFYHPHGWNTVDMMDAWGQDSIVDAEIDSVYGYGIRVRYGDHTTITRPAFIYLKHPIYESVGDFFFDATTRHTRVIDPVCLGQETNDGYAQLVTDAGAFLPGYGSARAAKTEIRPGSMPAEFDITGNQTCDVPASLQAGLTVQAGFGVGAAVHGRELQWSATNRSQAAVRPFLVTVLPASKATAGYAALRMALAGGPIGAIPAEISVSLAQGPNFSYRWRATGRSELLKLARIQAYLQQDGRVNLYAALGAESSLALKIDMVQDPEILLMPEPAQSTPSGRLIFDSGDPVQYPPEAGR